MTSGMRILPADNRMDKNTFCLHLVCGSCLCPCSSLSQSPAAPTRCANIYLSSLSVNTKLCSFTLSDCIPHPNPNPAEIIQNFFKTFCLLRRPSSWKATQNQNLQSFSWVCFVEQFKVLDLFYFNLYTWQRASFSIRAKVNSDLDMKAHILASSQYAYLFVWIITCHQWSLKDRCNSKTSEYAPCVWTGVCSAHFINYATSVACVD